MVYTPEIPRHAGFVHEPIFRWRMASERETQDSQGVGRRAGWAVVGYVTFSVLVTPVIVGAVLPMAAEETSVVPLLSVVLTSVVSVVSLGVLGVYTIFGAQ